MRTKRSIVFAVATCLGYGLVAEAPAVAQDKIVLKVADIFPAGHYQSAEGVQFWMEKVTELTGGKVEFQYYPGRQLGGAQDMLALAQTGVADITYISPSNITDKMPLSAVAELPGLFDDACEGTDAFYQMVTPGGILYEREYAPNGVRPIIAAALAPYKALTTSKRIDSIEDMAGLKIRTLGSAMDMTMTRLGAVSIRMPSADIYQSMSRGTIDGTTLTFLTARPYDIDTVAKYSTLGPVSFGTIVVTYSISEDIWQTLPADVQSAMTEAGALASQHLCDYIDITEDKERAAFVAGGMEMTLTDLTPEQISQWEERLAPVRNEWAKRLDDLGKNGTEVLNSIIEIISQKD